MTIDIDDMDAALEGDAPAIKFPEVGTTVRGRIVAAKQRQQKEFGSGKLLTWDNGEPRMEWVLTLDTDEGLATLYAKSAMWGAIRDAVRSTPSGKWGSPLGTLTVKYVGDGEPSKPGFHPPKLYKAKYEPAAPPADLDDLL
jgi:hypothetical protein